MEINEGSRLSYSQGIGVGKAKPDGEKKERTFFWPQRLETDNRHITHLKLTHTTDHFGRLREKGCHIQGRDDGTNKHRPTDRHVGHSRSYTIQSETATKL